MTPRNQAAPAYIEGPFGSADHLLSIPVTVVRDMYRAKCDYDPKDYFGDLTELHLYRCSRTGMEFWRPEQVAGPESFYRELSGSWDDYYKEWRWEYDLVVKHLAGTERLLEVGCGRGYFLRDVESRVVFAKGIELNSEAIAQKVTRWGIEPLTIQELALIEAQSYDVVCSFQVLEHVANPACFIASALKATRPGGIVALSVPNYAHSPFQRREDAFDLPPHHMNHFTEQSLMRIADYFGITLIAAYKQTQAPLLAPQAANFGLRLMNAAKRTLYAAGIGKRAHGHTMLGVFRA